MKRLIFYYLKLSVLCLFFIIGNFSLFGQKKTFIDGIQRGTIKVKFEPSIVTKLSQNNVKTKNNQLSVGITNFDNAAVKIKASNMKRLFPYDPKHEEQLIKHGLHLWYVVDIDSKIDPEFAVILLKDIPEISTAECNYEKVLAPYEIKIYRNSYNNSSPITLPFNDPYLRLQWHYQNTGQNGYPGGADINLFKAWNITAGASDIIVSVHDQGIDVNHEDLKDNIWINTKEIPGNGIDDDGNGYIDDIYGFNFDANSGNIIPGKHGTHIAGTIAATNNNGIGVSGIAGGTGHGDGVKIMSLQILKDQFITEGIVERSYIYAANNGAVISQNSWGYNKADAYEEAVMDAINYFIEEAGKYENSPMKGGIVIFAAGNDNKDAEWYPPCYDKILAVSSIGPDWKKASYSNFGEWVNVAAPGGEFKYGSNAGVLSTVLNNQYGYMDGTSMACPHVAGIAALALANRTKQMTNTELWNKIVTGVKNIDSYNPDYIGKMGTGAIDAYLVIKNNMQISPDKILDLKAEKVSQDEVHLIWTVPSDDDDGYPLSFKLYYNTDSITSENIEAAQSTKIANKYKNGDSIKYILTNLCSKTKYFLAIKSQDRWGNVSELSNIITVETGSGPKFVVEGLENEIGIVINASTSAAENKSFFIKNEASGILRWESIVKEDYLSLNPSSGIIPSYGSTKINIMADVSNLKNGVYNSTIYLNTNDTEVPKYNIHVKLKVTNHKPDIIYPQIVDFNKIDSGNEQTIDIILKNIGLGDSPPLYFSIDNKQFEVVDLDYIDSIAAQTERTISIKYRPSNHPNETGILQIYSKDKKYLYKIYLTGGVKETPKISIKPDNQKIASLKIGDEESIRFKVKNIGKYPLKYFIPGHDSIGIGKDWAEPYHNYGYTVRTSDDANNPVNYSFQDISKTGIDITPYFLESAANWYYEVDMGFLFPFYGKKMEKIYITRKGYTAFDNTINPVTYPKLNMSNTPKGFISLLGLHSVDLKKKGRIYYKTEADRLIIQYTNIWRGQNTNPEMNLTAQMVLYSNGDIRFYYDDITARAKDKTIPVVLIESYDRDDGILLSASGKPNLLRSGFALGLDYPGPNIVKSIQNGSGIVAPGDSLDVKVLFETSGLDEGIVKRNINIISNDPANKLKNVLVELNVTSGGIAKSEISESEINFNDVYENAIVSYKIRIKNKGSANLDILDINSKNNKFNINPTCPFTIKPGSFEDIDISVPTSKLDLLEDLVLIKYSNGSKDTIKVKANIISKPDISLDLSPIKIAVDIPDTINYPLNITNMGGSVLDISVEGNEWINFHTNKSDLGKGYIFSKKNNGESYEWIDIRLTGKRMADVVDNSDMNQFWQSITLPFTFNYYGTKYNSLKVSVNGVISLGNDNPQWLYAPTGLPISYDDSFIFPFWIDGCPDVEDYDIETAGVFYQCDENKCVISWEYMMNNQGFGTPISFQVILYRNGYMKFQYKPRGTMDYNASLATIGLQKSKGIDYMLISYKQVLDYGDGLCFIISPNESYHISPGETVEGTITLNSNNVMGGIYNGKLKINSNVPNKEILEKVIDLSVKGSPILATKDTIDFGGIININAQSITQHKNFFIVNSGSAPLKIQDVEMLYGNQCLYINMPFTSDFEYPIIEPGKSIMAEAVFEPGITIGNFEDKIIMTTNAGIDTVSVKGYTYEPPVINIDTNPIDVWLPNMNEDTVYQIKIDNIAGKYPLKYKTNINYLRNRSPIKEPISDSDSIMQLSDYREIKYLDDTVPHYFYGTGGKSYFSVATKYNAGEKSFNVSELKTYFCTDDAMNPFVVYAEIRTGGKSIGETKVVSKGSLILNPTDVDTIGKFYTIKLDNPAEIYPNEDFYAIIIYPLDISNPQGFIDNTTHVSGRYFYMTDDGIWRDFQSLNPNYTYAAWLMSAVQNQEKSFDWLVNDSKKDSVINVGDSSSVQFRFVGKSAKTGYQYADIEFSTNDPKDEQITIPTSLYVNKAPVFLNIPQSIDVYEGVENVYEFEIVDPEGDYFVVKPLSVGDFVTYSSDGTKLKLTITPQYGDAGNYNLKFVATDIHNASSELNLKINVIKSNRPPIYIGLENNLFYNTIGNTKEYNIKDFFSDPDGDDFVFNVESQDLKIVRVSKSGNDYFNVTPIAEGTTNLVFTLTDVHGAVSTHLVKVIVKLCIDPNGIIFQKKNNELQLKNVNYKNVISYQWFKNGKPIPNAMRKLYVVNTGTKELDFDADYTMRIITENDSIFTCPFRPIRKGISLQVTPNPVKQGEQVKIEIRCSDEDFKTYALRIISLSGQVLKNMILKEKLTIVDITVEQGIYLIELSGNKEEQVVKLIVN